MGPGIVPQCLFHGDGGWLRGGACWHHHQGDWKGEGVGALQRGFWVPEDPSATSLATFPVGPSCGGAWQEQVGWGAMARATPWLLDIPKAPPPHPDLEMIMLSEVKHAMRHHQMDSLTCGIQKRTGGDSFGGWRDVPGLWDGNPGDISL